MSKNKTIIGSGLCGPLLAILLGQRGFKVDLYEKRNDIRIQTSSSGKSINLALSYRGIETLKAAKVFDDIKPLMIPMKGRMLHLSNGKIKYQSYSTHSHEYINSISRLDLNRILINKAEGSKNINICFDHQLKDINQNKFIFNNKKIPISKYILGADGVGSVIRKHIDKNVSSPSFIEPLGHSYKELHIPPSSKGDFQLEPNALHIWPRKGFMLIALPNSDKSFTCTLFLKEQGETSFQEFLSEKSIINFFKIHFNDVLSLIENFPDSFFSNPTGKLGTVYAKTWQYNDQFCLFGDAAHAIVPFFGQGMNASFEDCRIFIELLDKENRNWDKIFNKYSILRKPDGDAIAKMAIENYIEMRDLVVQNEFINRKKISNILWDKFPNYFIPRYNMVSFTSIPYSEVYRRGQVQSRIIDKLNLTTLDFELAQKLIYDNLNPLS